MQERSTIPVPDSWRSFSWQYMNGNLRKQRGNELIKKGFIPYVWYRQVCMIGKLKWESSSINIGISDSRSESQISSVGIWSIYGPFRRIPKHTCGTEQPRPPQTRGAIFASLEGSDLPSSGSSRGLQQRAQSPPRSRVAIYPRAARAEASSSALNLRLARG